MYPNQASWWSQEIHRRARARMVGTLLFLLVLLFSSALLFLLITALQVVVQFDAKGEIYGLIPRGRWTTILALAALVADTLGLIALIAKGLLWGAIVKAARLWVPTEERLAESSRTIVGELRNSEVVCSTCADLMLYDINQWPGDRSRQTRLAHIKGTGSQNLAARVRECCHRVPLAVTSRQTPAPKSQPPVPSKRSRRVKTQRQD